ncbi:MAG: AAA family ATPase [bacterium]|nr:AAA family ATPase [bacterium]
MTDEQLKQELEKYRYQNVVISGLPGCGSTTLLNGLKEELEFAGWRGFSGGEFMRAYATERGLWDPNNDEHHSAAVYSDDFDREVDFGMREKLNTQKQWIIESWLAGFMAQNVPGVLKILMICSSNDVRIDRVMNRDDVSVEVAKRNTMERYQKNLDKWSRMYAQQWQDWVVAKGKASPNEPINFWKPELYDLVIDTYGLTQEEGLRMALRVLRKEK